MSSILPSRSSFADLWTLDPEVVYLNHGSFGACPRFLLEKQQEYRSTLENEPIRFLMNKVEGMLEDSRSRLASLIRAKPEDVVFVQNATSGVNTVFRSLKFNPGDEILYTNHIYGACKKTLEFISSQTGAVLVEATYPFPIRDADQILDAVMGKVTAKTRIALIDHITSATALIHPVEQIVKLLEERGIDTMVDGAHALGSIDLDLEKIGAAYYTANCHKWLCAPKGAAILHVRKERQKEIFPLTISHAGYDAGVFAERFFWPGTWDPSAFICAGVAVDYLNSLLPGGIAEVMQRNHAMCVEARMLVCDSLGIGLPCPDEMLAAIATIPLPVPQENVMHDYKSLNPLQELLFRDYHIEIPVWNWNQPLSMLTRFSVQLYNSMEQYEYLGEALKQILKKNTE